MLAETAKANSKAAKKSQTKKKRQAKKVNALCHPAFVLTIYDAEEADARGLG